MEANMQVLLLVLGCFSSTLVLGENIPVLLWTNDGSEIPSTKAGHTVSSEDFRKTYLESEKQDLVAFIQDKLSLEDFTQNADVYNENSNGGVFHNLKTIMDSHQSVHLPSVESPTSALNTLQQQFKGKVHHLKEPYNVKDLSLDKDGKNLIIAHLPATGKSEGEKKRSLSKIDVILGSVTNALHSMGREFTALYSAQQSSQTAAKPQSLYMGRHLLADADNDLTFFNVSNCLYFFVEAMTLISTKQNGKEAFANFTLPPTQTYDQTSSCNETGDANLVVNYTATDLPSGLNKFSFKINFAQKSGEWYVQTWSITYEAMNKTDKYGDTDLNLNAAYVQAPVTFSYHCSNVPLRISNTSSANVVYLKMTNFQVQTGKIRGEKFGMPNDCTGFFTIPIWEGIIGSVVLIIILSVGITMLSQISTMDRFDDPKGKTISVNVAE